MTKEFLHEVVKKRELSDAWTVPTPRMGAGIHTYAFTPYTDDGTSISDMRISVSSYIGSHESVPPISIITSPYYRMYGAASNTLDRDNDRWVAEITPGYQRLRFRRSNVRIGNLPISTRSNTDLNTLARHAGYLLNEHSCYPDYNLTSIVEVGPTIVMNYTCARCGQRFSGSN